MYDNISYCVNSFKSKWSVALHTKTQQNVSTWCTATSNVRNAVQLHQYVYVTLFSSSTAAVLTADCDAMMTHTSSKETSPIWVSYGPMSKLLTTALRNFMTSFQFFGSPYGSSMAMLPEPSTTNARSTGQPGNRKHTRPLPWHLDSYSYWACTFLNVAVANCHVRIRVFFRQIGDRNAKSVQYSYVVDAVFCASSIYQVWDSDRMWYM